MEEFRGRHLQNEGGSDRERRHGRLFRGPRGLREASGSTSPQRWGSSCSPVRPPKPLINFQCEQQESRWRGASVRLAIEALAACEGRLETGRSAELIIPPPAAARSSGPPAVLIEGLKSRNSHPELDSRAFRRPSSLLPVAWVCNDTSMSQLAALCHTGREPSQPNLRAARAQGGALPGGCPELCLGLDSTAPRELQ